MKTQTNSVTYEVWLVQMTLGAVNYRRPCVVYDSSKDGKHVWVCPLSTKNYADFFKIDSQDTDFAATGLTTTSYAVLPTQMLERAELRHKLGILTGDLACDFKEWMGL